MTTTAAPTIARLAPSRDAAAHTALAPFGWSDTPGLLRVAALQHAGWMLFAALMPLVLAAVAHRLIAPVAFRPETDALDGLMQQVYWAIAGLSVAAAAAALVAMVVWHCRFKLLCRQHTWRSVRLDGAPLAYAGTFREHLVPVLATLGGIVAVFLFFAILKQFIIPRPSSGPSFKRLLVSLPLVYLMGLGAWRARAYLLTRTAHLDGTGTLDGSAQRYAGWHLLTVLLVPLTLGWIVPWRQAALQRRLLGGMAIGGRRFDCVPSARAMLPRFAIAWIGVVAIYLAAVLALAWSSLGGSIAIAARTGAKFTLIDGDIAVLAILALGAGAALAVLLAWAKAGLWRHLAASTRLDGRPLRLDASTASTMRLLLGNLALRLGTLGVLGAVAEARTARFLARHVVYA